MAYVRPAVTDALSATSALRGTTVHVKGTVKPNLHGRYATLQRYYAGGWHSIARQRLSSTSHVNFAVRWTTAGKRYYRVAMSGVSGFATGIGGKLTLTVR